MPLVVVLASTGADIVEGIAGLEGWGRVARALVDCSGVVPTVIVVDGPAVSGPALLLGLADLVVMTIDELRVRQRTGDGHRVHGGADHHRRARRRRRSSAATPACPASSSPTAGAAVAAVAELLAYLPSSADEDPGRWPCDDPIDRPCPEAAS